MVAVWILVGVVVYLAIGLTFAYLYVRYFGEHPEFAPVGLLASLWPLCLVAAALFGLVRYVHKAALRAREEE